MMSVVFVQVYEKPRMIGPLYTVDLDSLRSHHHNCNPSPYFKSSSSLIRCCLRSHRTMVLKRRNTVCFELTCPTETPPAIPPGQNLPLNIFVRAFNSLQSPKTVIWISSAAVVWLGATTAARRGVQDVHWVMHTCKCIMVKVGGRIHVKYVKSR